MEPCSIFTYFESRIILLSEITKRKQEFYDAGRKCPQHLLDVQSRIAKLEKDFPDYFYGHYLGLGEQPCPRAHGRVQYKSLIGLIHECHEAFEKTTMYFHRIQLGKDRDEQRSRPILAYKHIIGAHFSFGKRASFWVRDQGYPNKGSLYLDKFHELPRPSVDQWHFNVGAKTLLDIAWAYVHRKWDFIEETRKRIGEGEQGTKDTVPYTDDEIEEMWWMLVLRGICWALSVRIDIPAEPMSSSFYGNRMPIWIT